MAATLAALATGALAVPAQAQATDTSAASVAVGGVLWWDENGDGMRDGGDRPLLSAEVEYSWGRVTRRLATGPDGHYSVDLPAATSFSVCVASFGLDAPLDVGIVPTMKNVGRDGVGDSDVDPDNCVRGVSPTSGARRTYDAGFRAVGPVSIGDRVWLDADADGTQDPDETPLPGVTLTVKDMDGAVLGTTITDASGTYRLREYADDEQVTPGFLEIDPNSEYNICFDASTTTGALPADVRVADLKPTVPNAGADALDSDLGIDGCINAETTEEGGDPTLDAGFTARSVVAASIQGFAWFDLDRDGLQEPDELPVSGAAVRLTDVQGTAVTTEDDGTYALSGLPSNAKSEICFDPSTARNLPSPRQARFRATSPNVGNDDMTDSDIEEDGCIEITAPADGQRLTIDVGFLPSRPALALKRAASGPTDVNGNGLADAGDELTYDYEVANIGPVPLADIQVTNDKIAPVTCPAATLEPGETMTCAGGSRHITAADVEAGEVVNSAIARGKGPGGELAQSSADNTRVPVDKPVTVGDLVWFDEDGDGIQAPEELPLQGVTVTVNGPGGAVSATTTAYGRYAIDNLLPNTNYKLCFDASTTNSPPAGGLKPTRATAGGDRGMDSDVTADGCVQVTTPEQGLAGSVDAGFTTPAAEVGGPVLVGELDQNGGSQLVAVAFRGDGPPNPGAGMTSAISAGVILLGGAVVLCVLCRRRPAGE